MRPPRTLASALLAGAVVLLAVGLVGQATETLEDGTVDAFALAGLALLAVGQAVRVRYDRRPRAVVILLLVLALIAVVLLD